MSSSNNQQINQSPLTKRETPEDDAVSNIDTGKGCNLLCQEDIKGLFDRVKKSAQAMKTAARSKNNSPSKASIDEKDLFLASETRNSAGKPDRRSQASLGQG